MNSIALARLRGHANSGRISLLDRLEIMRSRRALARLDNRALRDIGMTRAEAQKEARRPIWDI